MSSNQNPFRSSRPIHPPNANEADLERLRAILGFTTISTLASWLSSPTVDDPFQEFRRDYLSSNPNLSTPDFHQVMLSLGVSEAFSPVGLDRYAPEWPDKTNWAPKDHYARFVARVWRNARRDWEAVWPAMEEEEDLAMVWYGLFEVLLYLADVWRAGNVSPESERDA